MKSHRQEEEIFAAAQRLKSGRERSAYLDAACSSDTELRRRVEELLQSAETAEDFFAAGAMEVAHSPFLFPVSEQVGGRIGPYKLLQQIGEGAVGTVYLAEQEQPVRRQVALKIIKLGMDTRQVVARFEAERHALGMMDHPNIARVFDAGATETGRPYFVMELVRGAEITAYCDEHRLSVRDRLRLFIQICHAVQHAHQKGIIHRDLKPSNILVTIMDGEAVPKVIDFGIAKAIEGRLTDQTLVTSFEQLLGTPAYMSPEQALLTSADVDTRSDVYSLGVLLYELLTGKTPFETRELLAAGIDELRKTILEKEPPRPSTRVQAMLDVDLAAAAENRCTDISKFIHSLCGDLDWIVMKCLEKDRVRRYDTTNALALEITRYLKGEPVVAHPISSVERMRRWCRRKPLIASLGLSTTALVLAIAIGSPVLALHINRERERAQRLLSTVEIQRARMLFASDQARQGLAFLARALRQNPSDRLVAEELLNELSTRGLLTPAFEPFKLSLDIYSAEFSPDGRSVAVGCYDGKVWIFDSSIGRPTIGPLEHKGEIRCIRFNPTGDRIATASWDDTAKIWDAKSGTAVTPPLQHSGDVWSVAWSPDGALLATASYDGTATIWEATTGKPRAVLKHNAQVAWAEFSPDGRMLATASWDHTAQLWDVINGQKIGPALKHQREVWTARFNENGRRLVTCSWDKTARIWDTETGRLAAEPLQHEAPVVCATFSPDGQRVVTASWDGTARLWNALNGKQIGSPMRHQFRLENADFSPDGELIVTASMDHTARIWDARTAAPLSESVSHEKAVRTVRFSPDGRKLLSTSDDHTARLWEIRLPLPFMRGSTNTEPFLFSVLDAEGRPAPDRTSPDRPRRLPESGPVPKWLPDLAEALAAWRIDSSDSSREQGDIGMPRAALATEGKQVDPTALLKLKADQPWKGREDFYSRWAEWILADPRTRSLNPFSSTTVNGYVQALSQKKSLSDLRDAARLDPTNAIVFARLARELLADGSLDQEILREEADWSSRRALSLQPNGWESWWSRAKVLQTKGKMAEAALAMRKAAEHRPVSQAFWMDFGVIAQEIGEFNDAEFAFSHVISQASDRQAEAFMARARIRRALGRLTEAAADQQLSLGMPLRDPSTPSSLIDLSLYHNASMDLDWHGGPEGWSLAKVPHGRTMLGGIEFDIRGIIQLNSPSFSGRNVSFPSAVTNIAVGLKCQKLHFLHATGWSSKDETIIGAYRVHFADGNKQHVPIIYGVDIRDWGAVWTDGRTDARNAVVAWKGNINRPGGEGCLYRFTWTNSIPSVSIVSLDFESTMTASAPFLVGITAETKD